MIHRIQKLVESKLQEEGWEDCFLVEIEQNGSKTSVFLDRDTGMSFEKCRKMSRHLEAILDENLWLGEKYTLEVSSPGTDKPLKLLRQYHKNMGRTLKVTDYEDVVTEGELFKVSAEEITLQVKGTKKSPAIKEVTIEMEKIKKAIVQISFK